MRCHIRVQNAQKETQEDWGLVVGIDESLSLIARDETVFDLLLGELARIHPFSDNGTVINSILNRIDRDGISNPACVVPAQAIHLIHLPEYFTPTDLPVLRIDMGARRIVLPDGQEIDFDAFCGAPPDRWEDPRYRPRPETSHIFGYRYTHQGEVHETDLEYGSIVTGIYAALVPGPWDQVSHHFTMLAGILLGRRGDLFNGCVSAPVLTGASGLTEMRSTFLSQGHVGSSRAWMPTHMIRGRDFALCEQAARPDLLELGARLAPLAAGTPDNIAHAAVKAVLDTIEEDPVQFHLRDRRGPDLSNHQQLAVAELIRDLAVACQIDPQTLEPKGAR